MKKLVQEVEDWEHKELISGDSSEYKIAHHFVMTPWNQRLVNEEREYNNPFIFEKIIDHYDLD